ncbi:unnamed protein product [Closterium sp. NIES-65]|nr:unnamed protein product [Closterium sp. NIES-65]
MPIQTHPNQLVLQVDLANAFNAIERAAAFKGRHTSGVPVPLHSAILQPTECSGRQSQTRKRPALGRHTAAKFEAWCSWPLAAGRLLANSPPPSPTPQSPEVSQVLLLTRCVSREASYLLCPTPWVAFRWGTGPPIGERLLQTALGACHLHALRGTRAEKAHPNGLATLEDMLPFPSADLAIALAFFLAITSQPALFSATGPAPSGVSQVDPLPLVEPVKVTGDSGAARGAAYGGAEPAVAKPERAEPRGAQPASAEPGVVEPGRVGLGGAEHAGVLRLHYRSLSHHSNCASGTLSAHTSGVALLELEALQLLVLEVLEVLLVLEVLGVLELPVLEVLQVPRPSGLASGSLSHHSSCASGTLGAPASGVALLELEALPLEVLALEALVLLVLEVLVMLALLVPGVLVLEVLELPELVVLWALELEALELEVLQVLELLVLELLVLEALELPELVVLLVLEVLEALEVLELLVLEVLVLGVLELPKLVVMLVLEVLGVLELLELVVLLLLEVLEVLELLVPEVLVLEVLELLELVVLQVLELETLELLELVVLQVLDLETLELGVLALGMLELSILVLEAQCIGDCFSFRRCRHLCRHLARHFPSVVSLRLILRRLFALFALVGVLLLFLALTLWHFILPLFHFEFPCCLLLCPLFLT